jgi:hypothetical protein
MVLEPTPWWRSPAWLRPAAAASLFACLLTASLWPVAVIVRRRHHIALGLAGREARAHLWSRLAAAAIAAVTIAWAILIGVGLTHLTALGPALDPWLFVMHFLSVIGYLGGGAALVWAAYVAWAARRTWPARLWTTVLALSALVLVWTAAAYHLMSFRSSY